MIWKNTLILSHISEKECEARQRFWKEEIGTSLASDNESSLSLGFNDPIMFSVAGTELHHSSSYLLSLRNIPYYLANSAT